jgi:hypothetical protein
MEFYDAAILNKGRTMARLAPKAMSYMRWNEMVKA